MSVIPLFLAVVDDLYQFARDAVYRFLRTEGVEPGHDVVYALAPHAEPELLVEPSVAADVEAPSTFRSMSKVLEETARPSKNTVMYTGAPSVPLYKEPTVMFDGIIVRVPYGALLMVLGNKGRWSFVAYGNKSGWVLRDELVDRSAYVYPDFTIGEENLSDAPNTLRTRAVIEDEFGAGLAELPLQSSEYVLYKLYRKGIRISWPDVRPRVEGTWHDILKGGDKVHVTLRPLVGSLMEYTLEDGRGHLAYVEAVYPDETLSISEVNFGENGIYNERVLTKEEWRELKPVFLRIG